jgi:hypothetical protein
VEQLTEQGKTERIVRREVIVTPYSGFENGTLVITDPNAVQQLTNGAVNTPEDRQRRSGVIQQFGQPASGPRAVITNLRDYVTNGVRKQGGVVQTVNGQPATQQDRVGTGTAADLGVGPLELTGLQRFFRVAPRATGASLQGGKPGEAQDRTNPDQNLRAPSGLTGNLNIPSDKPAPMGK